MKIQTYTEPPPPIRQRMRALIQTLKQGQCVLVHEVAAEWSYTTSRIGTVGRELGCLKVLKAKGTTIRQAVLFNPEAAKKKPATRKRHAKA